MALCKVCTCGEKVVFEGRLGFPDNCPSCGRKLVDFLTYNEDDPRVELLVEEHISTTVSDNEEGAISSASEYSPVKKVYILKLSNSKEIEIHDNGGIVGRAELGAEELAEFPSVSRQHIRVIPRRNVGVLIEDISTYGTLIDGNRIIKNTPVIVSDGAKVTLCEVDAVLTVKETTDL